MPTEFFGLIVYPSGHYGSFLLNDAAAYERMVEGHPEPVALANGMAGTMYRGGGADVNPVADMLAAEDDLTGTVIIVGPKDEHGNDTHITAEVDQTVREASRSYLVATGRPSHIAR